MATAGWPGSDVALHSEHAPMTKHNPFLWLLIGACCGGLLVWLMVAWHGRDPELGRKAPTGLRTPSAAVEDRTPERAEPQRRAASASEAPPNPSPRTEDANASAPSPEEPASSGFADRTSSAGPALRLLRDAGFDVPELDELDRTQVEQLDRSYSAYRSRIEVVGMDRMLKLHALTRARFERGEFEQYTYDPDEREAGAQYEWEKDPDVGHAVRNLGFDAATGLSVARVVRVFPGDHAEIDDLDDAEDRLRQERQRELLRILGR